jgi:ribosomal protein S18 acetylase RimI-like enzyme
VRRCPPADVDVVADLLAAGFVEDPWFRWLWPDDGRYPDRAREWFTLVARTAIPKGDVHLDDSGDAVALWMPPGVPLADDSTMAEAAALLSAQLGDRAPEALAALATSADHAPAQPHHACVYVAVRPARQGRGLGERVMRPALDTADAERVGAHLVSTNPRNLGFYRRLGFAVTGELPVAGGSVIFRPMWRDPAGG